MAAAREGKAGAGRGRTAGKAAAPDPPPVFFKGLRELEAWLAKHHASEKVLVVGLYKKETGRQTLTYDQMLDAALCFGWIDGVRRTLGDGRWTTRLTPRKASSGWSRVNIGKAQDLIAAGRMRPAGLSAFEARDASRSEVYSYEQPGPGFDPAEEAEFRQNADAWSYYQRRAASYRRTTTWWVISAKKPETRRHRLETLIESCAGHMTIPQMTPISRRKPAGTEPKKGGKSG